ncbi:hypothetical protein BGX29_000493 [Mortierella sp. GBA35]|nr:hypothetical protein BGX29_000493 [Mortierella sp. GBA35]
MTSTAPSSAKRMSMSKSPSSSPTSTMSSPRSFTPPPSGSLAGRHVIYRGLQTSSMEYMSLTHSRHPEAAHMIKGEILISGSQSGYIQYSIVLDHEWMTRKVKVSAMYSGHEKRLVLEVDQEQRWYKVTEHRAARTRSFYRSGLSQSSQGSAAEICSSEASPSRSIDDGSSDSSKSHCNMQDADASLSDSSASCYSSSSDSECSIPFEKINLTWTPPPKGTKRASKRFSSMNLLGKISASANASSEPSSSSPATPTSYDSQSVSSKPIAPLTSSPSSPSPSSPAIPMTASPSSTITTASQQQSPVLGFASSTKSLTRTFSSSSQSGLKKYEHLPHLDGCVQLDLGYEISPSTLILPLRRATLGVDPEKMRDHLESLSVDGASTTEKTALISFPDLELKAVQQHLAFAGPGRRANDSLVECWQDDEDESMLIEVDGDGFVIRDGYNWARIPSS